MSSMASNYDVSRLLGGQMVSVVAVVCAAAAAHRFIDGTLAQSLPLAIISLGYGIMMFASSYVEEEQHFWYWATTAWFAYLGLKGISKYGAPGVALSMSTFGLHQQ
jgi:ethanolamine phosphate transferase 2 subunit G